MTEFKKGDKFIPHKPKENKKSPKWTPRMDEYNNKVLTVEHISPYTGVIHTDDCPFVFHPDWCEKVGDSEIPNNHIPMKAGLEMISDEHIGSIGTSANITFVSQEFPPKQQPSGHSTTLEQALRVQKIPNNHIPDIRKTIDWEQRRYELAKSAMQGLIVTGWNIYEVPNLVGKSIEIADEMIKQLKQQ